MKANFKAKPLNPFCGKKWPKLVKVATSNANCTRTLSSLYMYYWKKKGKKTNGGTYRKPPTIPPCEGKAGWGNQGSCWTPPSALMSSACQHFDWLYPPTWNIHTVTGISKREPYQYYWPPCIPVSRRSQLVFKPLE